MNGQVIKYVRKALNLTQGELAEKVGVSLMTIWRYEKNTQKPQPKSLRSLQQVLGYTEEDLVEIEELLMDNEKKFRHARLKTKLQNQARI
jgi:transcriptional regulator with XRE-family HTH domain